MEFVTVRSSGARLPGFKSQGHHLLVLATLCACFLLTNGDKAIHVTGLLPGFKELYVKQLYVSPLKVCCFVVLIILLFMCLMSHPAPFGIPHF